MDGRMVSRQRHDIMDIDETKIFWVGYGFNMAMRNWDRNTTGLPFFSLSLFLLLDTSSKHCRLCI